MDFPSFVNETVQNEQPKILREYSGLVVTFEFEKELVELIDTVENKWRKLAKTYNWGTHESEDYQSFAFNMNIIHQPDFNTSINIIKSDEYLTESGLTQLFHQWLIKHFDILIGSLANKAPLFGKVYYEGRQPDAKTLLLIAPKQHKPEIDFGIIRHKCNQYMIRKVVIFKDVDDIEMLKKYEMDIDYRNMVDMGMVSDSESLIELKAAMRPLVLKLQEIIDGYTMIEETLPLIKKWSISFSKKALPNFYKYLARLGEKEIIDEIY